MSQNDSPQVRGIFICSDKGLPMIQRDNIMAIAGLGLEGDRYMLGTGAYSNEKHPKIRQLSLIGIEAVSEANKNLAVPFYLAETRRNIITEGVDLNELVGVSFRIGDVALFGTELCDPCIRPSKLTGKPGFKERFEDLGGLRAQVLTSGSIAVRQEISINP